MDTSLNATRRSKLLTKNDHAETGIGTLIVFIAMILVAAVAAGVLVRTSTNLQQQAEATGSEATDRVATGLEVAGVFGQRHVTSPELIDNVTINLQLSSGSPALDLSQLKVRWSDGSNPPREMSYTAGAASNTTFNVAALRDADGSFSTETPVVNGNDMIKINITTTYLTARMSVTAHIMPEGGVQMPVLFTTPNTYTTSWITLR